MANILVNQMINGIQEEQKNRNEKYYVDTHNIFIDNKKCGCCGWVHSYKSGLTVFFDTDSGIGMTKLRSKILLKYVPEIGRVTGIEKAIYIDYRSVFKVIGEMLSHKIKIGNTIENEPDEESEE